MNPVLNLWKKRIIYFTKLFYQFIAFQFDAVILAYTLALLFTLAYLYFPHIEGYLTLLGKEPGLSFLRLGTLVILLIGQIRGYLMGPDEVFLSPMNVVAKKFVRYSEVLSITLSVLGWSFFVVILYIINPFVNIGEGSSYLNLLFLGGIIKVTYMYMKYTLYHRFKTGFGRVFAIICKGIYWGVAYIIVYNWYSGGYWGLKYLVTVMMYCVLLMITIYLKKETVIKWVPWITDESHDRARMMAILLGDLPKEKRSSRKSTSVAFNGRKIEPFNRVGALLLLYFRILFRGKGNILFISQTSIVMMLLFFTDSERWFIAAVQFFTTFLLSHYLVSMWYQLKDNVWLKIYPFSLKEKNKAMIWGPFLALVPLLLFNLIAHQLVSKALLHPLVDPIVLGIWGLGIIYIKASTATMKMHI